MKIVILNECYLKKTHLDSLKKLGEVVEYQNTNSEQQVIERLEDADVAIVDSYISPLNRHVFQSLKAVKYITINSTGYDLVDLDAAKANNIQVSNIPEYTTEAVAEHAISLMFAVSRHLVELYNNVKHTPYEIDPADSMQKKYIGSNVKGKTIGIIGLGRIGSRVAEIAHAMGMEVVAFTRSPKNIPYISELPLDEMLKKSDIVSVHTPLTKKTENLIGKKEFDLMKPNAIIINTARGKIIDENALHDALKNKKIRGAGLDLITNINSDNPLLSLDSVVITPHSAWYTFETIQNLADEIVRNVMAYSKGSPIHLIS